MNAHPLDKYLAACRVAHATRAATPETAYYPALQSLFESAGGGLKPRVHCVMGLKDQGAGMPDGGFFTPDQFVRGEAKLKPGQLAGPSRGVVECKPLDRPVRKIADTKQVTGYWVAYNQVLVTNYREFLLVGRDTLARVDRDTFFAKFNDAEAVQYSYEPFLEAFDPDLRKQLGVWYTPPKMVRHIFARVHHALFAGRVESTGVGGDAPAPQRLSWRSRHQLRFNSRRTESLRLAGCCPIRSNC